MTSEIRSNTIKSRAGLGTVTFSDTGAVLSGIVTASDDFRANEIRNQSGLGTITMSNTGAVFSGILTATKFVGDGTGLTGNLSYSGNYLGMTDTPSSYTAGAFHRSNNAGNAMQNSATLFEDDQGRIGVGLNSPSSRLHLKQNTDATYMTIECGANSIPYFVGVLGGASSGFYIDNGATFNNLITANSSDYVFVYGGGQQRLETTNTGVTVSGVLDATGDIQLSDKIYHAGDTNTAIRFPTNDTITFETAGTERLRVDSSGNTTFSGNVSIGGTLTYEDVTNIDSIGIITARSDIKVGTAVTITSAGAGFYAGIITASDFVKRDGTSLGGGGLESDAQNNTVGGTNAGDSFSGTNAIDNTLIGYNAGTAIAAADNCVFIGSGAGSGVVNSGSSIAIGKNALSGNNAGEENTAVGYEALQSVTSQGEYNTAFGHKAGRNVSSGEKNVLLGYQAGMAVSDGQSNVLIGYEAGKLQSSANSNTFVGYSAGSINNSGNGNVCIGQNAQPSSGTVSSEVTLGNTGIRHFRIPGIGVSFGTSGEGYFSGIITATNFAKADGSPLGGVASDSDGNTVGGTNAGDTFTSGQATYNTCFGFDAGTDLDTGDNNVFIGYKAGANATSSSNAVAVGYEALHNMGASRSYQTAVGYQALRSNAHGQECTAVGYQALYSNNTGDDQCAFGVYSLKNSNGADNTAFGYKSLMDVSGGSQNAAFGSLALENNSSGDYNSAIGYKAGDTLASGNNNTFLGQNSQPSTTSVSNEITLGNTNVNHLRVPGIGVSFSEGGAVISGIVTATNFAKADGSPLGGVSSDANGNTIGGTNSGDTISTGYRNTLFGFDTGTDIQDGARNSYFGWQAGANSNAIDDVGVGYKALFTTTSGYFNTAIGKESLENLTDGIGNVAIGWQAGRSITSGDNNRTIGREAASSSATVDNEITLGNSNINHLRIPGIGVTFATNGNHISGITTFSSHVQIPDAVAGNDYASLYLGDGNDVRFFHNGQHSFWQHKLGTPNNGGNLYIDSYSSLYLRSSDGSSGVENAIVMNSNGSVDLYHSGTKKFETTSGGVNVIG